MLKQFNVAVAGRVNSIKEQYYGMSPESKIKHPAAEMLFVEAKKLVSEQSLMFIRMVVLKHHLNIGNVKNSL
jgi:hypothetical protein